MGTQFFGLLCLLFGMAAFFGLWLLSIKNRSKTIESDEPSAAPQGPVNGPLAGRGYSLSPVEQKAISSGAREAREAKLATSPEQPISLAPSPVEPDQGHAMEADDPMAKTHLDIASQFFSMGDFEGAAEMCQLVIDNQGASRGQKTSANQLKMECA